MSLLGIFANPFEVWQKITLRPARHQPRDGRPGYDAWLLSALTQETTMDSELYDELARCARERAHFDQQELELITRARTSQYDHTPWDWDRIAEPLGLPDGEAVQRRYQELAARKVGL